MHFFPVFRHVRTVVAGCCEAGEIAATRSFTADRDDVSWQFAIAGADRHFHSTLIVSVLNFREKKIFTQTRAFHFIGQIYRSAGSVDKFSIYQLVERLMQRNGDDVIASVALSPVEWLFSEFICPIGEKVRVRGYESLTHFHRASHSIDFHVDLYSRYYFLDG